MFCSNPSDSLRTISHVPLGTAKNKQISKKFNLKYKAVYRIICECAVGWKRWRDREKESQPVDRPTLGRLDSEIL